MKKRAGGWVRYLLPRLFPPSMKGLAWAERGLGSFPGGTQAEPEALWLESKTGLHEEGDGGGGGPEVWETRRPSSGDGRGPDRKGQGLPHSPAVLPNGGGRQFWWWSRGVLPKEAGGSRAGPSCHAGQEGGGRPPQLPAAPALVGESLVGQAWPTGPSATALWG